MDTKKIVCLVVAAVVIITFAYFIYKNRYQHKEENFGLVLGLLAPQRRFYDKCVGNCYRNFTGDSSEGQFLWMCTDYCEEEAMARVALNLPDLTEEQHERHSYCQLDFIEANGTNLMPILKKTLGSPQECYCLDDLNVWCREQYCPHSKNPGQCQKDCMRTRKVDCQSGMFGSYSKM